MLSLEYLSSFDLQWSIKGQAMGDLTNRLVTAAFCPPAYDPSSSRGSSSLNAVRAIPLPAFCLSA